MPYFLGSISHNFGDGDKIQKMNNAYQYIVYQSQLSNFVSISKQKSVASSGIFLQCAREKAKQIKYVLTTASKYHQRP